MKRKRSGWRKWMKTDLGLVLFQLPTRWQGSFTVHLSLSKQIGTYLSCCLSSAFAFIYGYLIKYSIECKSNVIAQYFLIFFHLFPYVSFLARKNFCSQSLAQSLSNDVKYYGKPKRVTTHLRRFYANVRGWMNIWLDARPYVEKYANVNAALEIWF